MFQYIISYKNRNKKLWWWTWKREAQFLVFLPISYLQCSVFLHWALFSCNILLEEIMQYSFLLQWGLYCIKTYHGKLDIDYSLKNIPIPSNVSFLIKLIKKTESVVKQIRWRAHFFLQEKCEGYIRREGYGFKSKSTSPKCKHMEAFDMIPNIKFRSAKDTFLKKLKEDITKITQPPNVFVFADKPSNIYKMPERQQKKLLNDNVTKTNKKAPPKLE